MVGGYFKLKMSVWGNLSHGLLQRPKNAKKKVESLVDQSEREGNKIFGIEMNGDANGNRKLF